MNNAMAIAAMARMNTAIDDIVGGIQEDLGILEGEVEDLEVVVNNLNQGTSVVNTGDPLFITNNHKLILLSNGATLTLSATYDGHDITVKNIDATNTDSVITTSDCMINQSSTYTLDAKNKYVRLVFEDSDVNIWHIVGEG